MRKLLLAPIALSFVVLLAGSPAVLARGQATSEQVEAVGLTVADAFNAGDADTIVGLIDVEGLRQQLADDLGLKPDQAKQVEEGMRKGLRRNVEAGLRAFAQKQGLAKFIRVGRSDAMPYSLVRIDYQAEDGGFEYLEYYVSPSGLIQDWYAHTRGSRASAALRLAMSAMMDKDSLLTSLLGVKTVNDGDVKKFRTFSKALAAGDAPGAYRALEDLPAAYRQTKDWAMLRASLAGFDDAAYRASLDYLARNFGDDSSVQFMLIDHFYYEQRFDLAYQAVAGFERRVGEDGATNFLKCSCLTGWKRYDEAARSCQRAIATEPDFKSGYWGLVTVGLESGKPGLVLEALSAYEQAFGVVFDPDVLAQTDAYRGLARTPEFAAWAKERR